MGRVSQDPCGMARFCSFSCERNAGQETVIVFLPAELFCLLSSLGAHCLASSALDDF